MYKIILEININGMLVVVFVVYSSHCHILKMFGRGSCVRDHVYIEDFIGVAISLSNNMTMDVCVEKTDMFIMEIQHVNYANGIKN